MPIAAPASRRLAWRRALAGAGLAIVVASGAACSAPAPSQKDLTAALVSSGLSKEVADCTAKAIESSLTQAEIAEISERGSGGAPVDDPKKDGESYDKLAEAMTRCRELQLASEPTTTLPPVDDSVAEPSTTIADGTGGAELTPASSTTTTAP